MISRSTPPTPDRQCHHKLGDHPLADLFPLIEGEEYERFKADLAARGLLYPITTLDGLILDGRNRFRACVDTGVQIRTEPYEGDDPAGFVIASNLHRRHLNESQRAMVAAKLVRMRAGRPSKTSPIGEVSQAAAAEKLNVGKRTVERAVAVRRCAIPELGAAVEQGKIVVSVAAKLSELPPTVQRAAVAEPKKAPNLAKQHRRTQREAELATKQLAALPAIKFGVIVEDFEWDYSVRSRQTGMDRHAANHYPVAANAHTPEEIWECTKDRFAAAAADCVLFMWTTVPMLKIALDLMQLRGFRYVSNYVWAKHKIATGHWNRNKHEHLLIGTRGNVVPPAAGTQWDSLIAAPVTGHSAKPERFLEMIEEYFPNVPKLELNRRGPPRPGWHAWGNEVE